MTLIPLALAGCSKKNAGETVKADVGSPLVVQTTLTESKPRNYIPSAIVYKTNGDYNNNVAVGLNSARTQITSYPDPTDVSAASAPVVLEGGYLLDRRGIGASSGFLSITYSDYHALKSVPSTEELRSMLIPDAQVTFMAALPITASEAARDIDKVNSYVKEGFKGCDIILK